MATAPPASPIEWTCRAKTRPALELQLLPPSPFAASEMGTFAASSPAAGIYSDLGALFDDRASLQPLPSGWERCLDLQSGKVFLKQSDDGASRALQRRFCEEQGKDEKPGSRSRGGVEVLRLMNVEQRHDWSLMRWLEGEAVNKKSSPRASIRHGVDNGGMATTVLDGEPVCSDLDLDLRLANWKRSKAAGHGVPATANVMGNWRLQGPSTKEHSGNLEVAKACSMVTAVCSKCLMYVLLRRSKAVCPRCSLPITIEGTPTTSVSRKRRLLEFPSLSTDSES